MKTDFVIPDEQIHENGERRLVAAVFDQAISDATGSTSEKDKTEARRWIESDSERPFGFVWCCHALGLDPQAVREKLREQIIEADHGAR